jgi:hypothetical protein
MEEKDKKTTDEKTTEDSKLKSPAWVRDLIWVLIGVIIGVVLMFAITTATASTASSSAKANVGVSEQSSDPSTEASTEEEEESLGITTYLYEHTVLEGDDADTARKFMIEGVDRVQNNNTYLCIQTNDDEYEYYFYNTNGEGYGQTSDGSYMAVYRNDGTVVKYGSDADAVAVGSDIEVMSMVRNAIQASADGVEGVQLFEMAPAEDETDIAEYRIDLVGEDAIKAIYISEGQDFADQMYEKLTSTALVNTEEAGTIEWDPHLIITGILQFNEDRTDITDFMFYMYYVYDNNEYTNWVMNGYLEIGEWTLAEDWYTMDYENLDEDKYDELMTSLTDELYELVQSAYDDMDTTTETDTEESTETSTEEVEETEEATETSDEETSTETETAVESK